VALKEFKFPLRFVIPCFLKAFQTKTMTVRVGEMKVKCQIG